MAVDASEIFCKFKSDHKLTYEECCRTCAVATYIRSVEDSKRRSCRADSRMSWDGPVLFRRKGRSHAGLNETQSTAVIRRSRTVGSLPCDHWSFLGPMWCGKSVLGPPL
jgi:hypothetical protein